MEFFATLTAPDGRLFVDTTTRQFVMLGLLGGYTTFSSFSIQTLNLMNEGEWLNAGLNIGALGIGTRRGDFACLLSSFEACDRPRQEGDKTADEKGASRKDVGDQLHRGRSGVRGGRKKISQF